MAPLEVAIAGCGIAGMAAALLLHRDGHRVTLFERFAAPRPIGSGLMLQPTGLAVLRALGLEHAVLGRGARIDRLLGEAGRRTVLDVRYAALGPNRFGIGIHRAALFEILHAAVRAEGIGVRPGGEVTGSERDGERRRLSCAGAVSEPFDLLIDALGARSILAGEPSHPLPYGALWATLPWRGDFDPAALQQRYRRASVMAGVLPVGTAPGFDGPQATLFWSLRADQLEAWREQRLGAWKASVETLWPATRPLLDCVVDVEQLAFARYAHRTLRRPVARALIHIGDAWHSTSPQLGQGANMALLDAFALALALREGEELQASLCRAASLRSRHVRLYQAMSRIFTPVYQSDGRSIPFVRDQLVGPLSKLWPATRVQAAMVSGLVGSPLRRLGLA